MRRPPGQVDFLRPHRAPGLGWVCLALGLLLLTVSGGYRHAALRRVEAQAVLSANAARQAKVAAVPVTPPAFTVDPRWRAAAQELVFPWDERLQALENATAAPVHLLSLNPDKRGGTLRLEAEVGEYPDALGYVDRLAQSGSLGRPVLLSHEMVQDPSGRPYMRVVISALWSGSAP